MTTKLTITLKADSELPPEAADRYMTQTLALLGTLQTAPLRGLTLTFECADEDTADEWRDDLRVMLTSRPEGIEAEIKKQTKEEVERQRMVKVTPMDKAWAN